MKLNALTLTLGTYGFVPAVLGACEISAMKKKIPHLPIYKANNNLAFFVNEISQDKLLNCQ